MALSATLSTTAPSTVFAGYVVNCYILVSNSATNSVTLQDIEPAIKSTPITFLEDKSSFSVSPVSLVDNPVPASGSQQYLMRITFHGSNRNNSTNVPLYATYDLGCRIFAADGSVTVPTPITITVQQNTGGR
jgi:hypothetical protein